MRYLMRSLVLCMLLGSSATIAFSQHSVQVDDGAGRIALIMAPSTGATGIFSYTLPTGGGSLIVSGSGPSSAWLLGGNTLGNLGGSPTQWLGTSTNDDVIMKANGNETLRLVSGGGVRIAGFGAGVVHSDGSGNLSSSLVTNADVSPTAAIVDTKLATISTAGKVSNSATTATDAATANAIVSRDASNGFSAGRVVIVDQNELRINDGDNSNFVGFGTPINVTTSYTLTFPDAPPSTNGQVLSSTTGGVLSWATALTSGSSAGGDLAGTYPNPTINASAITGDNIITAINLATVGTINAARLHPSVVIDNESPNAAGDIDGDFFSGLTVTSVSSGAGSSIVTAINGSASTIDNDNLHPSVVIDNESPNAAGDVDGDFFSGLTVTSVGNNAVDLTTDVTGILLVNNGGTGKNTANLSGQTGKALVVNGAENGYDFAALGGSEWSLTGNAGTAGDGTQYLGTSDAQPLYIKVNNGNDNRMILFINSSIAFGKNATTGVADAVAIGTSSTASGAGGSISIGPSSSSINLRSIAFGSGASSSGDDALALGPNSTSSAVDAIAIGKSASSGAGGSITIGPSSTSSAIAVDAIAIGRSSNAGGAGGSISIGPSSISTGTSAVAIGNGAQSASTGGVAIGGGATSGNQSVAIGPGASAAGAQSKAEGFNANAAGNNSVALGSSSSVVSTAPSSISIGPSSLVMVNSSSSMALGPNAQVQGNSPNSVSIGNGAFIMSPSSITIGPSSLVQVSSSSSIVMGPSASVLTLSPSSISIGSSAIVQASSSSSISIGTSASTTGTASTNVGGGGNTITGDYSAIYGGRGLTMNANRSFGFHSNNAGGTLPMTISSSDVFVISNSSIWLANNNNTPSSLFFYEGESGTGAFPSSTKSVSFKAPATLTATQDYTLPLDYPTSSGYVLSSTTGGTLSWIAAGGLSGGTTDAITKWTSATTIGNSSITDNASTVAIGSNFSVDVSSGNINTAGEYQRGGSRILDNPGTNNLRVGGFAGHNNTGVSNTYVGSFAGAGVSSGSDNVYLGYNSGVQTAPASSSNNVMIGSNVGTFSNGSSNNTFVGYGAAVVHTSGDGNTFLGTNAGTTSTSESNNTLLGGATDMVASITRATAIGHRAYVSASDALVLGAINGVNGSTSDALVGIGTTAPTQKLEVKSGNVLLSNAGTAGQLQLQGTSSGVTTFAAGAQGSTTINYTLPTSAPTVNGHVLSSTTGGVMSWIYIPSTVFSGVTGVVTTNDGDFYVPSGTSSVTSEGLAQVIIPRSGTLKNLYVKLSAAPGAGSPTKSKTVTVRINGVNTSLAVSVSGTSTTNSNTANTVSVSPGDALSLIVNHANTPAGSYISWGFELQ